MKKLILLMIAAGSMLAVTGCVEDVAVQHTTNGHSGYYGRPGYSDHHSTTYYETRPGYRDSHYREGYDYRDGQYYRSNGYHSNGYHNAPASRHTDVRVVL